MIVLDTNVISEAMRPQPNSNVIDWLNAQTPDSLYITSITLGELLFGIGALPSGKRQNALHEALDGILSIFNNRILALDADAARRYALLATSARNNGFALSTPDGYIAAIAQAKGFTVATRDTSPFTAVNVPVINPWNT